MENLEEDLIEEFIRELMDIEHSQRDKSKEHRARLINSLVIEIYEKTKSE